MNREGGLGEVVEAEVGGAEGEAPGAGGTGEVFTGAAVEALLELGGGEGGEEALPGREDEGGEGVHGSDGMIRYMLGYGKESN